MAATTSGREPRNRRPTMSDVGRLAGVSPTTVSFVVNDRTAGEISEATRIRVLEAVATLGYRPNRAARGLRTRRTYTVGFLSDEIAVSPSGGRTISGAHDVANEHGSLLYVISTTRDQHDLRAAVEDLVDRQVDAILFAVAGTRRAALPKAISQVPAIMVNCFSPNGGLPCVLPDEAGGGRAATEGLIAAGHRKIAYLTGIPGAWATRQRLKGYRAALRSAGIRYDDRIVRAGNFRADSGYELTRELLGWAERPTAILCGNDRMAVGAYLALGEAGVRVPRDMSVVGYDDQEDIAPEVRPALTTVHLPFYAMGRWAAANVIERGGGPLPARTYLPCPLVTRDSVACPARPTS